MSLFLFLTHILYMTCTNVQGFQRQPSRECAERIHFTPHWASPLFLFLFYTVHFFFLSVCLSFSSQCWNQLMSTHLYLSISGFVPLCSYILHPFGSLSLWKVSTDDPLKNLIDISGRWHILHSMKILALITINVSWNCTQINVISPWKESIVLLIMQGLKFI